MSWTNKLKWKWEHLKPSFFNFLRFFHNIYIFRKTLWNSSWWDYSGYLYAINDLLTQQIEMFNTDRVRGAGQRQKVKNMLICRELIKRQLESSQADWWEYDIKSTPLKNGMYTLEIETTKKSCVVPSDTRMARKIRGNIEQEEWSYLMKLLSKHLQTWWD